MRGSPGICAPAVPRRLQKTARTADLELEIGRGPGTLIWKDLSSPLFRANEGWAAGSRRSRGQGQTTVVTLISAGQPSRCRTAVIRRRLAASDYLSRVGYRIVSSRILGENCRPRPRREPAG